MLASLRWCMSFHRARICLALLVAAVMIGMFIAMPQRAHSIVPAAGAAKCGEGKARGRSTAESVARLDRQVVDLLRMRPGALVVADGKPAARGGAALVTVRVRETGGTRDLASVVVDVCQRKITSRNFLSPDKLPPRLREREAIAIARSNIDVRERLREVGDPAVIAAGADYGEHGTWEVDFWHNGKVELRVAVRDLSGEVTGIWSGYQIGWSMARGDRTSFGGGFSNWWIFYPFTALFLLVMIDRGRLMSMRNLDAVLLLCFIPSWEAFNSGSIEWSVPLAVPPVLALGARMWWQWARGVPSEWEGSGDDAGDYDSRPWWRRDLPVWALAVLIVFCCGARYAVNYDSSSAVDVGYAGVTGANLIIDGKNPYGNFPPDVAHGDTYGPLNYLAYVPGALVFDEPDDQVWELGLPAAHVVSIGGDLIAIVALALVGARWLSRRAAVLLPAAWVTYPFTGWTLNSNSNDTLMAGVMLMAFVCLPWARARGAVMMMAAAIKFMPLLALPVIAHAGMNDRLRQTLKVTSAALAVACAFTAFIAHWPGGLRAFVDATWGFQHDRQSPFSIWGLWGWRNLQLLVQLLVVASAAIYFLIPRNRDAWQIAAGIGAVMWASQLAMQHWFYLYLPWVVPFTFITVVAARERGTR